jgi:2-polyprenyl-6-methoxyphenol hydroxylase-like FAD-dependent oxidoreductase
MTADQYDAIVVGARCAGAPTAMLLSRHGHRVLLVDKATFPSDTISTHIIHPPGIAALKRWGLLDKLIATGCPAIDTYAFDFGPLAIVGAPGDGDTPAYAPRRTVLDDLLVDAASAAGVEVREGFTIEDVVVEDGRVTGVRGRTSGGTAVTERAGVVVGADGMRSLVARAVEAESYHERPRLLAGYYAYWSGLPMGGRFETYIRPGRGFAAWPTHDDLTVLIVGWPYAEFKANRTDVEGNYHRTLALAPAFAGRVGAATRVSPIVGMAVPGFFRKPYGPGWALVGDAAHNKDFITGMGMQDAFRDAESCAAALHKAFTGACSFDDAMAAHQAVRDAHALPFYEFTCQLASLEPPPPDLVQLLTSISGDQPAMDEFARLNAGLISPADYFAPDRSGQPSASP